MACRKEISRRPSVSPPVMGERIQSEWRQRSIAVRTIFGPGDMDPHVGPADILVAKMGSLTDTKTAAVHEDNDGTGLQVVDRVDKRSNFVA